MANQSLVPSPVIIIGSGMAGYTLARELRKLNAELPITLICRDNGDSYAKPTLSNAFAQNKAAENIANATSEQMAETLNLTVMNFYHVGHIDPQQKTVTVHPVLAADKQQILPYRQLVLATGANPRLLPDITVDNKQIFAVNHLDEYKKFQQTIHELLAKQASVKVGIIGAGLIGCEFANDLLSKNTNDNLTIQVFDNATLPLANQLPQPAGRALQHALEQGGVKFELGVMIDRITAYDKAVEITLKDSDGKNSDGNTLTHTVDVVLIAIGLVANTTLAESADIKVAHLSDDVVACTQLPRTAKQGILVNEFLQTSQPDIYAIGDCANVAGSFMPYVMPLMNQAKALAKTLADLAQPPTAVSYPAMPVAIKTPSLPLVVLPVSARYLAEQINWQNTPTEDGMILSATAIDNPDKLLGFVLVGKEAGKQRMTLVKQVDNWL